MDNIKFHAWALVASKAYCKNEVFTMWNKFFSVANLQGEVIFFNVERKGEIKSLLQDYQAKSDNERSFVKNCLQMIGVTGFEHEVPPQLVDMLNKLGIEVKREDIIYLSWVSDIK